MQAQTPRTRFLLTVIFLQFFAILPAQAVDTDGDGIDDAFDDCCHTPIGALVDTHGRPIGDFDMDCDTDMADYDLFQRGFTGTIFSGGDRSCNPVAQTGCEICEKCTFVPDDINPNDLRAYCRPEGSVQVDNPCIFDDTTAIDNCASGLICKQGLCTEICSAAPNSCPGGGLECTVLQNFVDIPDVGFCEAPCNPLADISECTEGQSCFINLFQQNTLCDAPIASPGTQGDDCQFINGCADGYNCALNNSPVNPTGLVCAFICDASQSGGPTCAQGPGASFPCAQINQFYANVPDLPDAYGMCVDPVQWDEDGDFVLDFKDQCPGTPPDTPVDEFGCPL